MRQVCVCVWSQRSCLFDPSAGTYYLTSVGTLVNQFPINMTVMAILSGHLVWPTAVL